MSEDVERLGLSKMLTIQQSQCHSRDNRYVQLVEWYWKDRGKTIGIELRWLGWDVDFSDHCARSIGNLNRNPYCSCSHSTPIPSWTMNRNEREGEMGCGWHWVEKWERLMTTIMNCAVIYSFMHSNAHTLYCAMNSNWMCDDYAVGVLFSLFCCCFFMYMVLCHSILCV